MSLETSVRECGAGLTSLRATERKKSGENLKNFLVGNAVPSLLSENTIQSKGYDWNDVFDDIHELVIKETEKYETTKNYNTVMGPLCANLLYLCVSGSIKGRAYIKCDKTIEACLFILRDNRLTKAIGDAYLNLLYKHILTCDHYLNNITPTAWEDLLDVCLSMCVSKHSKLDDYTKLRLLLLVIRNGSKHSQIVIPLKSSLTRLNKCFLAVDGDKAQEVVIEIMILIIEMLSVESRMSICEFTENLLTSIVKFYNQNLDTKKKASFFKLLQLSIALHHPLGRSRHESSSMASSWEIWNKHLQNFLEIVCLEVSFLQKQRKQQDNLLTDEFYDLAASVYYQIFQLPSKREQEEGESSSKRQRVSFDKNTSFHDLIEGLRQNHIPWLALINMYVKRFGPSISTDDYISLLAAADALVTNNSNLNWCVFETMVCSVISNLNARSIDLEKEQDVLISLWNSCVRSSTLANAAHKPLHSIMQLILTLDILKYQNVQPLIKSYCDRGMLVSEHSLKTLNKIFYKFFSKCSYRDERIKFFNWLTQEHITDLDAANVKELFLRLLVTENVKLQCFKNPETKSHHDIIFNSVEQSILFSEFELDILDQRVPTNVIKEHFVLNAALNQEIKEYFETKLLEYAQKLNNKEIALLDYMKLVRIAINYIDILLKYNLTSPSEMENESMYRLLRTGLSNMYTSLNNILKNNNLHILEQIKLMQCVKDILCNDYFVLMSAELRRVPAELFKSINVILNVKLSAEDDINDKEDDSIMDPQELRCACMCVLAAYCRKRAVGRNEILDFIMDPKIYNFANTWDINCALNCIKLLSDSQLEERPLESIFFLMQGMCKDLFKNSEATFKLLKVFVELLDQFWNLDNGKQNCCIMVRGYLQRCEKKFYPPRVAALIYECAAKVAALKLKQIDEAENVFLEAVLRNVTGEIHSIRLYCCYLLQLFIADIFDCDISSFLTSLSDIFVIHVSERSESILRDELINRTGTVLHCFLSLTRTKNSLLNNILTKAMQMQKDKSLDKQLVKKVLDKIIMVVTKKSTETYLNENILFVLHFWFSKGNNLEDIPLYLFGFSQIESFLEKHLRWLITAEILWRKKGIIKDSDILKLVQTKSGKSVEAIVEACISNIMTLCLPYVVTDKYGLEYMPPGKQEWLEYANTMYESTSEILGADKWSSLFVQNLSRMTVMITTHLRDHAAAKQQYNVNILPQSESYYYPKEVFDAILANMGELIEENVLIYWCKNRALTIFKALFKLRAHFLEENVFEYKVVCLHSFVMFLETIPLGHPSDAFVCNFACNSLALAIRDSSSKNEITVFVKALQLVLKIFLPEKVDIVRKPVSNILSTLMIKKEEGFDLACAPLLDYLTYDMKDCLKETEDVIDFITSLSQGSTANLHCSTMAEFMEKMKTYKNSLLCLSIETLINLRQFLKNNEVYVKQLCDELNTKGFSDDCGTSIIHQVIHLLSNTLKSANDDKTIIEACNCLAEIGNYDLKTLVTVPPANMQRVTNFDPKQYFAIVVMTSLTEILFDEAPNVTDAVTKTLQHLMQYREGKIALDLEEVNKQILTPFLTAGKIVFAKFKIDISKFKLMCVRDFWIPITNETHIQWVTRITCALLDVLASTDNYLNTLRTVCVLKHRIFGKILSPLLGLLLECSSENLIKFLGEQINKFFKHVWDLNFADRGENSEDSEGRRIANTLDRDLKIIVQYMLDIVNFVRLQCIHYKTRSNRLSDNLNYLQVDYDKVAWAATLTDQNMAAIYYGELWATAQNSGVPPASPEATSQLTGGENMQRIFRKCFVSIGEMDAIDGCGTAHLTSEDEKRKHLINTGQFADALFLHDIALSSGDQIDPYLQYGVVKSLHKSGMHHLALQYIKSLPENEELDDIKYECLSFLGDWSDFVNTSELEEKSKQNNCNPYSIIKAFRYSCLKDCLNLQLTSEFDKNKLTTPLNRAKRAVSKLCQNLNMENCQNVYKVVSKLHLFGDIEDYFLVRCDKMPVKTLVKQWQVENLPAFNDFKHLEALISQRSLILEHAAKAYHASLQDILSLQLQYTKLSLSNDRVPMAQRLLAVVKKIQSSPELALADSQISWAKGHKDIAISMLRNIVLNPPPDVRVTAAALRQYGTWMAETKCDNAREIINKYLKKSLEVLSGSDHEKTRLKVYYDIAKFADAEYKQVIAYMNSSVFEKKLQCIENMRGTANSLRSTQQLTKDERKALTASDRFGKIDAEEIASTKSEKQTFLHLAMRYYLLSLKQSEANNLSVFRVISLWLDNQGLQLDDSERGSFEDLLHSIPSWKYITVLPQLAPRLTNDETLFADNLKMIITRCAVEHPHHTLPILFNLKNSDKDRIILNAAENVGGSTPRPSPREPRIAAAEAMISQLAQNGSSLAKIVEQMEKLCDATISLANYVPKKKEMRQKIPAAERLHQLRHLDAIPIPTVTIPIRVDCHYSYLPTLYEFDNYFELVGGINCPKKITCRSSDGQSKILLIKGEDDLRQDAVMQQVFNIVNTLLENDPVTSRNKLLIRTYKVVPMSRRSGVLEWCEGTMPIGQYLVGERGAHNRYRPKDISASAARAKMTALHEGRRPNQEKLCVFLSILKEFRPVFHHFFTEHYLDPVTWYERRLAYTKSVASSSMVGYILGLGDRHLQNILIDKRTAEVVHIDFGIAFDQGRTLPTPETIPFRLTQDIVAGFGSSGVEGTFRRSCEKTMQLLRDNQETLLTILEVLLCDPLYSWTVTSKQQNILSAQSRNTSVNISSGSGDSLAKRALLTVSSKLSGTEGGVAGGVAVPGQVARLIHSAMNPANLSRLFHGWQPYL